MKNKVVTILIVIATIILAGIAIFTAIRLYQLRQEAVAPTAPEKPSALTPAPTAGYDACTAFTFTVSTPAPGACNSSCETDSDCTSPTEDSDLICYQPPFYCPPGQNCIQVMPPKVCRNESCETDEDCICSDFEVTPTPTPTATSTPGATKTPSPTPTSTGIGGAGTGTPVAYATSTPVGELPDAGVGLPAIIGIGTGIILLIISLALAL
jgi:hypothetical protein